MSGIRVDRFVDAGLDCSNEGTLEEALTLLCYELPDRHGLCPTCGQMFSNGGNGSQPGHDSSGCNPLKSILAAARVARAFYRRARFLIRSATGARPPVAASGRVGLPPSDPSASSPLAVEPSPQWAPAKRAAPAGRAARSRAGRGIYRRGGE